MYGKELEQELHDCFQSEVKDIEPHSGWWDNIVSHLEDRKYRSRFRFMPKTRFAWALVPLAVLLLAGTVYGATTVIGNIFQRFAGHVEEAGLAQEMDLSQTIDGVTVKLERAYADSNIVLMGYTVSGPAENYTTKSNKLTTADGEIIKGSYLSGFVPGSTSIMDNWQPDEKLAVMAVFDTDLVTEIPSEFDLHLEIEILDWTEHDPNNAPVAGIFEFDFSLPANPGQIIDVGQTIEAEGMSITLDEVSISPWGTKAVFRFNNPDDEDLPSLITSQTLPDGTKVNCMSVTTIPDGIEIHSFKGDFTEEHGEWIISIDELVFSPDITEMTPVPGNPGAYYGESNDANRLSGPWEFRFDVP